MISSENSTVTSLPHSIRVEVELKETSQKVVIDALNTYTKGPLFCVYRADGQVVKFPLANVWRITEDYS